MTYRIELPILGTLPYPHNVRILDSGIRSHKHKSESPNKCIKPN